MVWQIVLDLFIRNELFNFADISIMAIINLFGASGHARVIMDIIAAQGDSVGCLYDDSPRCAAIPGVPVLAAGDADVQGPLIVSIGSNTARRLVAARMPQRFAVAVHPSAVVSPSASVGEGSVVMQGAVVQADARIGRHCIVNTGASVDHECIVGDYAHISPHATLCGNVHVGEGAWIGAGAVVIPGVSIGKWCVVGAGSVVVRDIPDGVVAFGSPCCPVRNIAL